MHNTNSFNSFTTNILKLKNYVNKNYQGDNKNEILYLSELWTRKNSPYERGLIHENHR